MIDKPIEEMSKSELKQTIADFWVKDPTSMSAKDSQDFLDRAANRTASLFYAAQG